VCLPTYLHRLSGDCFYQLRQLLTVAHSLPTVAPATLVHPFVTTRLVYFLSIYSGLPSVRLASLDRVLRSAERLVGQLPKFSNVTSYMLEGLRWLPVQQGSTGSPPWCGGASWSSLQLT